MSGNNDKQVFRGVAAGLISGFVGSWVMMRFMEGPGTRLQSTMLGTSDDSTIPQQARPAESVETAANDSVTMQAADRFVNAATGGRHLSYESKRQGGDVVHYVFGIAMGGFYGGVAEYASVVSLGTGSVFGTVLWAGTDLLAIPAVGFAPPPQAEPPSAHAAHWMAHVVYSMSMELVRRAVRRII